MTKIHRRFDFAESKLNKDKGLVENVHILGMKSANGYTYAADAVKTAVPKYENAPIYLNHSKTERMVESKFGYVTNPRFIEGKGIYGDVQYNTAHPYAPSFAWWVESAPKQVGMSHSVGVEYDETAKSVTAIETVNSVDLVSDPATVKGLFESIEYNTPPEQEKPMDIAEMKTKHADLVAVIAAEAIAKARADEAKLADAVKDIPVADRSEVFIEAVRAVIGDAAKVAALVNDRKALVSRVVSTETGKTEEQKLAEQKLADAKKNEVKFDEARIDALLGVKAAK